MSTITDQESEYETSTTRNDTSVDALALAGAAAVVSAAVMLLLGVFGAIGVYQGAVEMMQAWHLYFEPTLVGTVAGMIEAAVIGFVFVYAFAWLYNMFNRQVTR